MAPVPESNYFPPLDKCLQGEELLISWKAVFYRLLRHHDDFSSSSNILLESFFSDSQVQQLLARPFDPFSFTQSNTKAAFETKTAAINVTPTSKSDYNINEIKEDSLWLSKEVQIDEISALRIVVLEYQSRSVAQLQNHFSNEEAVSLQTAAGNINSESSNLLSLALSSAANAFNGQPQSPQEQRRLRAIQIYLSECQNLLACSKLMFHIGFRGYERKGKGKDEDATWIERVAEAFVTSQEQSPERFLHYCITSVKSNFDKLDKGSGWFQSEGGRADVESEWLQGRITEAIHILEISLVILDYRKDTRSSENVVNWFKFASACDFFENFGHPDLALQALMSSIQSLVSVISLSMLDCPRAIPQIWDDEQNESSEPRESTALYITDLQSILTLHEMIWNAASNLSNVASPAVLAWSIILFNMKGLVDRRREAQSRALEDIDESPALHSSTSRRAGVEGGLYAEVIENITVGQPKESPIEYLARCSIDGTAVFSILETLAMTFGSSSARDLRSILDARIRIIILDVIRCGAEVIGYSSEIFSATLASLTGASNYWDLIAPQSTRVEENPVAYFMQDDDLVETFLSTAASRYPHESLPFLKIIHAISTCEHWDDDGTPVAINTLESLPSFMFALQPSFRYYQTIQEEENLNKVELTEDFMLFNPRTNSRLIYGKSGSNGFSAGLEQVASYFCIPAGTQGRIVSENNPKVALWFHEYSGLKYLGKLIETGMTAGEYVDAITGELAPQEDLAEMVSIMATLILTSVKINKASGGAAHSTDAAYRILEQASDGLDRHRDIASVIFSIFEEELERQADGSASDTSLDLLNACVHFIYALVPILPARVWPLIGRSGLLDQEGRSGRLTTILSSIEFVNAKYDFLLSCVHLFGALVEDSATHAAFRKGIAKSGNRTGTTLDLGTGVPDHVPSKAIASCTKTLLSVFESACNWRFAVPEQRLLLSKHISTIFDKILHYNYGIGDNPSTGSNLTTSLGPAAHHIVETFLSPTSGLLRFQPLFRGFLDGFATPDTTVQTNSFIQWIDQVKSILGFTKTLVQLGTLMERPASQLEDQLFKVSPLIARLYAMHDSYRLPVVTLLEALVISASGSKGEPPSLLGHLGQETSKNFLNMLMHLGKPLDDDNHGIAIWHLFSAVVSNRQQWFAIYLLTGRKPRDKLKETAGTEATAAISRPLISIALDELTKIQSIPMLRALPILEFVSLAQNYWPWAMKDVSKKSDFITPLSDYINSLEPLLASASGERSVEGAYQARIAAYIAEILAMHLYHSRQLGNLAPVKDILSKLKYFTSCAVAAPTYNASLHGNLKRNLEARYPGCNLQDFKRTRLETRTLGQEYFYNLDLANKMLWFHQAWTGTKGDGMSQELVKANINLSVVDAQISLLHGWKMLAIELSNSLTGPSDVQVQIAIISSNVAGDCLISNTRSQLPETIFARLNQTRAEFALTLLQKLLQTGNETLKLKELLPIAWKAIVDMETTFELALESSAADAMYYRTLLKILFLVLRVHVKKDKTDKQERGVIKGSSPLAAANLSIAIEILDKIVGQGFRDIATAVHAQSKSIVPDDIALITALLQTCLLIPGIETRTSHIQAILTAHDTARMASALFSWADKLAIDGDPVYGELSILFLLELSNIPELAEQLAVEGILGYISSAPLTVFMRRPNIGPFSDSVGAQRCYSIWARGILPLLLNLLARLEASIAGEVAIFLTQFPNLLQQAEHALELGADRRLGRARQDTRIALLQVSEIHSLALLVLILKGCRTQVHGVPEVQFDAGAVLEAVEVWLGSRQVLGQRIVALGTREAELEKRGRLEGKVVEELEGLRDVLMEFNEGS